MQDCNSCPVTALKDRQRSTDWQCLVFVQPMSRVRDGLLFLGNEQWYCSQPPTCRLLQSVLESFFGPARPFNTHLLLLSSQLRTHTHAQSAVFEPVAFGEGSTID